MKNFSAFLLGLLFAAGLGIGGMTMPSKIIGFLNFFGGWDPSLAFVMGGAVLVYFFAFRIVRGASPSIFSPVLGGSFALPTKTLIDRRLIGGAALFGFGWGLAGYCPGPALTSIGAGSVDAAVFAVAMIGGMIGHRVLNARLTAAANRKKEEAATVVLCRTKA